jgi:hypothetical protein
MNKFIQKFFKKKRKLSLGEMINLEKKIIGEKIHKIYNGRVALGPYKNTRIIPEEKWSFDLGSKILGVYEKQVQEVINNLSKKKKIKTLVNFGAAEGFHLTGLIKNRILKRCLAFEIDDTTKKTLKKNIKLNKIEKKVKIFSGANFNITNKLINPVELKKTLFLIDIEGMEYKIITENNLNFFKTSYLLIEKHPFMEKNKNKKLKFDKLLKKNFIIENIKNSQRNPFMNELKNLNDDTRWILMSEGRPCEMEWILCHPKR